MSNLRRIALVGAVGVGIVFIALAAVYVTALAEWGIR